jgi:major membrane immunogen (membrane-anchored lipoprotein)
LRHKKFPRVEIKDGYMIVCNPDVSHLKDKRKSRKGKLNNEKI